MADDRRRDDARPGDPAEGVRIIGAEEAAEAIERGDVASRRGTHLPRYGDRPARPPAGSPKPALRFPLDAGADPAETPSVRPAKGIRFDPRPAPAWDDTPTDAAPPEPSPDEAWPAEPAWGEAGDTWEAPHDEVVAWSRGETGAQPVVDAGADPAGEGPADEGDGALAWAEGFVGDDEDDPWDGTWDEPTGAVRWADDVDDLGTGTPVGAAADEAPPAPPVEDPAGSGDEWAAFSEAEPEPEAPRLGRRLFGRRSAAEPAPGAGEATDDEPELLFEDLAGPAAPPPEEAVAPPDAPVEVAEADVWAAPDDDEPAPVGEVAPGDEAAGDADEVTALGEVASGDRVGSGDQAVSGGEDAGGVAWDDPWPDDEAWDDEPAAPDAAPPAPAEPVSGEHVTAAADDAERGPLFDDEGGWADEGSTVFDFADEPSGQVELPHWTEPATGELPRVLAGDEAEGAAPAPTAHWRGHDGGGWDAGGFDDLADGEELRVGALDDDRPHHDDMYSFDELDDVDEVPAAGPPPRDRSERRRPPARPVPEEPLAGSDLPAGRNLGVAVGVGVAVAAVALVALSVGGIVPVLMVAAILVLAVGEYHKAVLRAGYRPAALLGLVATAALPLAVYWRGIEAYPLVAVLVVAAALAWHLVGADGDARVVESVGVTLLGVAWIGGLGSFAALLLAQQDGTGMLIAAVLATVGYDVGGLFIGRTMGSKPLSDASPNKTVEGLAGGIVVALFVMLLVGLFGLAPFDQPGDALLVGLVAALAAPLGDLCQSLVKRDLGLKDMGSVLPGHGGVLDRFDAMLFVLPAVYYGAVLFSVGPFG